MDRREIYSNLLKDGGFALMAITRSERDKLQEVGLLQFREVGIAPQDANFSVANKFHKSRAKTYYVTETNEILKFLGHYNECNVQRISENQYKQLKDGGMIDDKLQEEGTLVPGAVVYHSREG